MTAATPRSTRSTAAAASAPARPLDAGAARARGGTVVGMPVPEGSAGDRLLEALGYHVRWTSWVLQLPEGTEIVARAVPDGYAIREADPDEYAPRTTVVEDAFLEWSVRERESFEDFAAADDAAGPASSRGTSASSPTPTARSSGSTS